MLPKIGALRRGDSYLMLAALKILLADISLQTGEKWKAGSKESHNLFPKKHGSTFFSIPIPAPTPKKTHAIPLWRIVMVLFILSGALLQSACVRHVNERSLDSHVAPAPDRVWTPPPEALSRPPAVAKQLDIPENLLQSDSKWQLTDIIEVALRNNPDTRATWYSARATAADLLSKEGSRQPEINAGFGLSHTENIAPARKSGRHITGLESGLNLTWLLLDFGGREAAIAEKQQALLAADFSHNAAIQNAVFLVLQTYFQYASAKALRNASETSLHEAETNLEAAEERHRNGLATIAEVLLAKTALSQARLNLDVIQGRTQTIRGALATAMGIPANTPYDIEDLVLNPPVERMTEEVDAYIQKAAANRPDLAAQRKRVEQYQARIKTTDSALYPSLVLTNDFSGVLDNKSDDWTSQNKTALMVKVPLYKGYSLSHDALKSRQELAVQKAQLESLGQTVILQVWSSFFNLKTSAQRVKTSEDLLKSALQSYDVSLGRYKEGVGGLLDLLSAQSTLEIARAQQVSAQTDWYISFAQLSRDTGLLWQQPLEKQGDILEVFPSMVVTEKPQ